MRTSDPNQTSLFGVSAKAPEITDVPLPINAPAVRVQDIRKAAYAEGKSLIRLQRGYGAEPWIIKVQSQSKYSHGWKYLQKFDNEVEANQVYADLLATGDYVEG